MRKRWGPLAAALSILCFLAACHSDQPEDQVRKAFETSRAGVESGTWPKPRQAWIRSSEVPMAWIRPRRDCSFSES